MSKNYLVPMWSRQNGRVQNHLALIKANDRYQAMLIAIGSHGKMDVEGNIVKEGLYADWNVDMNYEAYQECKNPNDVFTYMDRSVTINKKQECTDMDIYEYMYWGDYNARIKELADKALPEKWSFDDKDDFVIESVK